MKPDWKDAPDWANFLAMDKSGDWYWYQFQPTMGSTSWSNTGGCLYAFARPPADAAWFKTREERPA